MKRSHPNYIYKVRRTRSELFRMFKFRAASVGVYLDGEMIGTIVLPYHLIKGSRKGDEVIFESIVTERPERGKGAR